MEYRGMTINAETTEDGKTVYRIIRYKKDGTISPTPWTYASIESAQSYVYHHGF